MFPAGGRTRVASRGATSSFLTAPSVVGSPEVPRGWAKVAATVATAATAAASDAEVEEELAAVLEDMASKMRECVSCNLILDEKSVGSEMRHTRCKIWCGRRSGVNGLESEIGYYI